MKRLLIVSVAAVALALVPMAAAADEGEGDQHFGPFAGASPDSGTCGNDWAADTFTRNFMVHQNADGSGWADCFSGGSPYYVGGTRDANPGNLEETSNSAYC